MPFNGKALIIVPAFNEASTILNLLGEIRQKAPFADTIVVNDCSTDNTAKVLSQHDVPFLSLPANLGIGGAVQTGFKYAREKGYDAVVQVDGDGQHDPASVKVLLDTLADEMVDVVIGSRYLQNTGYKTPMARRFGMIIFSALAQLLTGSKVTDTTSGLRALNKRAIDFFADNYPVDFPDAEAIIMLKYSGFRIIELPVVLRQRQSGRSTTGFVKSLYYPFRSLLGIFAVLVRKRRK